MRPHKLLALFLVTVVLILAAAVHRVAAVPTGLPVSFCLTHPTHATCKSWCVASPSEIWCPLYCATHLTEPQCKWMSHHDDDDDDDDDDDKPEATPDPNYVYGGHAEPAANSLIWPQLFYVATSHAVQLYYGPGYNKAMPGQQLPANSNDAMSGPQTYHVNGWTEIDGERWLRISIGDQSAWLPPGTMLPAQGNLGQSPLLNNGTVSSVIFSQEQGLGMETVPPGSWSSSAPATVLDALTNPPGVSAAQGQGLQTPFDGVQPGSIPPQHVYVPPLPLIVTSPGGASLTTAPGAHGAGNPCAPMLQCGTMFSASGYTTWNNQTWPSVDVGGGQTCYVPPTTVAEPCTVCIQDEDLCAVPTPDPPSRPSGNPVSGDVSLPVDLEGFQVHADPRPYLSLANPSHPYHPLFNELVFTVTTCTPEEASRRINVDALCHPPE